MNAPEDAVGAGGDRLTFPDLPVWLRAEIEARLGGRVAHERSHRFGFSPAMASTLVSDAAARVFVKALPLAANPDSGDIYRREIAVNEALPGKAPAPRLAWHLEADGWIALGFHDVHAAPPALPWRENDLARAFATLTEIARLPAPDTLPRLDDKELGFHLWRDLASGTIPMPDGLDPWASAHVDDLAEWESRVDGVVRGDRLVHTDLRADNLLMDRDRVWVVDWPWAVAGSPLVDAVIMLPSVLASYPRRADAPDPDACLRALPHVASADPDAVTAILAGLTGYFAINGLLPSPASIPKLRGFQRAQGRTALAWLQRRIGDG